ncbi:MAG: hypothetical protein U9N06_03090 [candidate division WOR-3 bacterium]|nr:hypothetical protein [candidate division WOR-3 bacterium]
MKDKLIIFLGLTTLLFSGCSIEGESPFDKFLSKTVNFFSPKSEKAEVVNLITAVDKKSEPNQRIEKTATIPESASNDTLKEIEEALHWGKIYYSDIGKPDPFRSLLAGKEEKEKEVNVDLAKLVGIIWGKNGYLALLKEGNRGYVLREGDRVIDGRVLKITEDTITFLLSRFGLQNEITMQLKKQER